MEPVMKASRSLKEQYRAESYFPCRERRFASNLGNLRIVENGNRSRCSAKSQPGMSTCLAECACISSTHFKLNQCSSSRLAPHNRSKGPVASWQVLSLSRLAAGVPTLSQHGSAPSDLFHAGVSRTRRAMASPSRARQRGRTGRRQGQGPPKKSPLGAGLLAICDLSQLSTAAVVLGRFVHDAQQLVGIGQNEPGLGTRKRPERVVAK